MADFAKSFKNYEETLQKKELKDLLACSPVNIRKPVYTENEIDLIYFNSRRKRSSSNDSIKEYPSINQYLLT